ncbi:MAG: response regulator, partial [Campylobacterota bacterium]|nr:response regulator [Campylobacterota bacterium]
MKPKILIVDDQDDIRIMIKIILKRAGDYEYIEASNGKSGYELAIKELPHLILMDAIMPIMDGFESIKYIRENSKTRNIPILMISALSSSDDKVKAISSGMSDFIAKPFDKTELIIRVNSLLHLYLKFEKKRLELEDINANLEQKINERLDRRVEEIRLASIGEVTAGITHELNTPVTYMKANLELLGYDIEDIKDNEKIKDSMQKTKVILDGGISRLKNIIDSTKEIVKKGSDKKDENNIYSTIIHSTRMVYSRAKHLAPIYINKRPFTLELDENSEIFNANII